MGRPNPRRYDPFFCSDLENGGCCFYLFEKGEGELNDTFIAWTRVAGWLLLLAASALCTTALVVCLVGVPLSLMVAVNTALAVVDLSA